MDLVDAQTGTVRSHDLAEDVRSRDLDFVSLLGWRGDGLIIGQTRGDTQGGGYSNYIAQLVSQQSGWTVGRPVILGDSLELRLAPVAAEGLLASAPFVDLPPPSQSALSLAAFSWWFSQHRRATGVIILAIIGLGPLVWRGTRRRRRRTATDRFEQGWYADGTS